MICAGLCSTLREDEVVGDDIAFVGKPLTATTHGRESLVRIELFDSPRRPDFLEHRACRDFDLEQVKQAAARFLTSERRGACAVSERLNNGPLETNRELASFIDCEW